MKNVGKKISRAIGGFGALALGLSTPAVAEAQMSAKQPPSGSGKAVPTKVEMDSKVLKERNRQLREKLEIKMLPESIVISPTKENTKFYLIGKDPENTLFNIFGKEVLAKVDQFPTEKQKNDYRQECLAELGSGYDMEKRPGFLYPIYFGLYLKNTHSSILESFKQGQYVRVCCDLVEFCRQFDQNKYTEEERRTIYNEISKINNHRGRAIACCAYIESYFKVDPNNKQYYSPKGEETLRDIGKKLRKRDVKEKDVEDFLSKDRVLTDDDITEAICIGLCAINGKAFSETIWDKPAAEKFIDNQKGILIPKVVFSVDTAEDFMRYIISHYADVLNGGKTISTWESLSQTQIDFLLGQIPLDLRLTR